MSQSRMQSLIEAMVSTCTGFTVSVVAQMVIFGWVGISVSLGDNIVIALAFTVLSLLRSYLVRRVFVSLAAGEAKR